MKVSQKRATD